MDAEDENDVAFYLYNYIMREEWKKVVKMYKKHKILAIKAKINMPGDTALHVVVSMAPKHIVEELVDVITGLFEAVLGIKNNEGNTPLHVAASLEKPEICVLIADKLKDMSLWSIRNNRGESPLFLAVSHGRQPTFLFLNDRCGVSYKDHVERNLFYRRNDGETILHCAISWEYFDLAYQILKLDKKIRQLDKTSIGLANYVSEQGITPLHLLANRPLVFRSGCHLRLYDWKFYVYYCTCVKKLKPETVSHALRKSSGSKITNMCYKGRDADVEIPSEMNVTEKDSKNWVNWTKCLNILSGLFLISFFLFTLGRVRGIVETKRKHEHAVKIMKKLIKNMKIYPYLSNGRNPQRTSGQDVWEYNGGPPSSPDHAMDSDTANTSKTGQQGKEETPKMQNIETPILIAAKNGITPMVKQILEEIPMTIHDKSDGNNIVLLTVKYRQPKVLQLLLLHKHDVVKQKLFHELDMKENNALHLAAELGKQKPWIILGAALQMQWEINWYEFVKNNVPPHFSYQHNQDNKTPKEIFNETHEELVKEGGEWLKKTSEPYSFVAALIATVALAASTTIPGDFGDKGKPNLLDKSGLAIFAISTLVALFFSITTLFSFLSILTDRYEQKDFRIKFPLRLLFGLTTLFVAVVSMLVSFCAGHSVMLENKLKANTFKVYAGVTCLPIISFIVQQLPLYFDYAQASFSEVPPSSYKAISL